jgi:3-dehydroquinate dehydratase/shikimate dehydrogenase
MRQLKAMPKAKTIPKVENPAPAPPVVPRLRLGKLCVAIQASTPQELVERAEGALADALPEARFLEFRLDSVAKPALALPKVKEFLSRHRDVTAIGTCRRKQHGGQFVGSLGSELEMLQQAAEAGCQLVDLEVESAEEATPTQLAKFRAALREAGCALIVSFHDFTRTKGLDLAAERIGAFQPDYVKVVSTARSLSDNLAMLKLIEDRSLGAHVVGIAMGEEGLLSRVLGPRAGGIFTFASAENGAETAPGQITARALRDLYRIEQLDQATRIFGVAGNPISHSLSPLMHNTAF